MMSRKAVLLALAFPALAWGQAAPTATAPKPAFAGLNIPAINGSFQYGLTASEVIQTGYSSDGSVSESTNVSGSLAYSSKSEVHPFNLVYSGGLQVGQSGYGTTYYQSLAATQSYVTRSWIFSVTDAVSYLPQSPTVGLSGIPGTGDVGLTPVETGLEPSQGILSVDNNRLSNSVAGDVQRQLTAFTSISGGASYGILHFFGSGGLDSSQISAFVGLNRRIDARSSASLSATYGTYNYSNLGNGASFASRGLSVGYQRQLSRALVFSASGGPEFISSSSTLAIPSRLTYTAGAALGYTVRVYTASIAYSRGITGGAGVTPGGIADSISASLQRPFGNTWSVAGNVGYVRNQGLSDTATPANLALLGITTTGNYDGVFGAAQVSRRISRSFSAFGSYTAISQSYNQTQISPVALNGIVQSFALGISYFPRSLHLGQL